MELRVLLETTLTGMGYELVDLELARGGLMRLFIDSPSGITLDDCVKVSNHLARLFMVENVDYERLEVSSPGLDRPLTKPADFERFAGQQVKLKLRLPQDGARRVSGVLQGLEGEVIRVQSDGKLIEVPLSNLDKARLDPKF
ncbi:MAG: ribosome maturation factor RimP [Chitinivorax sp.]